MKYYLIPINETRVMVLGERLKDLLYEKYPEAGCLEVDKTTVYLTEDKKKDKKLTKIDKKLENYLDKNSIPKYLICYRFTINGDVHEVETNLDITFKSEKVDTDYEVPFEEAMDYFNQSMYDERLSTFLNKESILDQEKRQEEKKEAKKAKKRIKEIKKNAKNI